MITIEEILNEFDKYLDENNQHVYIGDVVLLPSEVLREMKMSTYLEALDIFIADRYEARGDEYVELTRSI